MANFIFTARTAFRVLRNFNEMIEYKELIESAMTDRHEYFVDVTSLLSCNEFMNITGTQFGLVRPLAADLYEVLYVFRHN